MIVFHFKIFLPRKAFLARLGEVTKLRIEQQKAFRCSGLVCTLVLLWLVLIGPKDLDGGETSDAILTAQ